MSQAWRALAACQDSDPYQPIFWGPEYEYATDRKARERKAKAVCARCPVRSECLEYALANGERDCVYGGLNPDERQVERRRRRERKRVRAA